MIKHIRTPSLEESLYSRLQHYPKRFRSVNLWLMKREQLMWRGNASISGRDGRGRPLGTWVERSR